MPAMTLRTASLGSAAMLDAVMATFDMPDEEFAELLAIERPPAGTGLRAKCRPFPEEPAKPNSRGGKIYYPIPIEPKQRVA